MDELVEMWRNRIRNPDTVESDELIEQWRKSIMQGDYI